MLASCYGMHRSNRMTSKPKIYSPDGGRCREEDMSNQSVPTSINAVAITPNAAVAVASGTSAMMMSIDDNTIMSSLASPVAQSKQSQEGNVGNSNILLGSKAEEDPGSSGSHSVEMGWDDGEKVNLVQESYNYTKVHNWIV